MKIVNDRSAGIEYQNFFFLFSGDGGRQSRNVSLRPDSEEEPRILYDCVYFSENNVTGQKWQDGEEEKTRLYIINALPVFGVDARRYRVLMVIMPTIILLLLRAAHSDDCSARCVIRILLYRIYL